MSPRTGYTRVHWEAAADALLHAAWKWATPGRALLDLPGRPSVSGVRSDGLEGYARTFLAAAFRVAGAGGEDPHGWLPRYAQGLASGTRTPGRADAESWPLVLDHHVQGQPMVESASVALGLRLTRPWLWDTLDDEVQDRAESWLRGALRHVPAPNNWYLFPYTVAAFLEAVGRGDDETRRARQRALELLESWYVGGGWYTDGDGRAFDHYNGWALHLYPVLEAHLARDAPLLDRLGPRLAAHLEGHSHLFGADGAPIHFGRSLTYRFAAGASVALGALTGHTPLRPGVSRRLISGALRHFLDRGAVDGDGLLTRGWHGPHGATVQSYSGPASPYWASKAFVALLAPADHALWTATEEHAPVETADHVLALPEPGLLVQSTRADGIVRLHNHGSDDVRPHEGESAAQQDPLYGHQAYSTHTGPTAPGNPPDNHLAVEVAGVPSVRRRIHPLGSGPDWAASWHRPVFTGGPPMIPGLRVESVSVAKGRHELRVHRITGAPGGARATQTGWATPLDAPPYSALHPLHGWTHQDEIRAPQGTAYTRAARIPRLSSEISGTTLHACLAVLSAEPVPEPDPTPLAEAAEVVAADDTRIEVRWSDGTGTRIGFAPLTVEQLGRPPRSGRIPACVH
ncbi:DUF2264 domain-containing protein [Streptomyces sp. Je 1-369]|uniref:DUF2264 domain-containing protein n=1 Tax=Streptomyces sp. Je 1-369 TaxID=2966192 RepID=UPI002285D6FA|nr:DUF2264 domain-containing protein [Streptomyces sp. Je 1-369]WAL98627.1 DUF2264 domain-containing protein [Streptomyces sp. Je 1-369]